MKEMEKNEKKNEAVAVSGASSAATQSTLGQLLNCIRQEASSSMVRVMQSGYVPAESSSSKRKTPSSTIVSPPPATKKRVSTNSFRSPPPVIDYNDYFNDHLDRAFGVTGHSMLHNKGVATSISLQNDLRRELGGRPTTILHSSSETVAQYRRNHGKDTSSSRRTRNDLMGGRELSANGRTDKMDRVMRRLCSMHRKTDDESRKLKIRTTMSEVKKAKRGEESDSLVNEVLDIHVTSANFASQSTADELLEYV